MPRRNRRSGVRPQAKRGQGRAVPVNWQGTAYINGQPQRKPRPKLLPMVQTVGTCPLGKLRYGTPADAEEALRRALINREILQSPVSEDRWYPQPGDAPCVCQGYHLTHSPRRAK